MISSLFTAQQRFSSPFDSQFMQRFRKGIDKILKTIGCELVKIVSYSMDERHLSWERYERLLRGSHGALSLAWDFVPVLDQGPYSLNSEYCAQFAPARFAVISIR